MTRGIITLTLLLIIAGCIGGFLYKRYRVPPAINLPVMHLTDLHGAPVSLQSYAGQPLFVNFFATWCGPCMRELPQLAELQSTLSDQKLTVICICDESLEKLQNVQNKIGQGIIILHSDDKFHDIGVYTYPTNYIYNSKGLKVYEKVNPDDWEDEAVINNIRQLIR